MTIETTRFGQLEIDPQTIITAPGGLIGLPAARQFVLMDHTPGQPFQWLQSVEDPALAFIVVDPYAFYPDYEVNISEDKASQIGITQPEDAKVLTTVSIRRTSKEVTMNLLGPLIIGVSTRKATQVVLDGDRYTTRHPLPARRWGASQLSQPVV